MFAAFVLRQAVLAAQTLLLALPKCARSLDAAVLSGCCGAVVNALTVLSELQLPDLPSATRVAVPVPKLLRGAAKTVESWLLASSHSSLPAFCQLACSPSASEAHIGPVRPFVCLAIGHPVCCST